MQHSPNGSPNAATPYSLRGTKWVSMYNVCCFIIQEVYRKSILARPQNCKKRLLASSYLFVCPDFH